MSGFVHIYTGDGKGKTTCAVGLAIRAAGAGKKVAFVQFDKGFNNSNEQYNERHILRTIHNIDLFCYGCERMMSSGEFRRSNEKEDFREALEALKKARTLIVNGDYFLVILDECVTCAKTGLLKESDIIELIELHKSNPYCDLVFTGRGATQEMVKLADLVTEMLSIKHYFDKKVPGREGIDY